MAEEQPEVSIDWLQKQIVTLLTVAKLGEQIDHQACAKYCELLYKMMPKSTRNPAAEALEAVREGLKNERAE